MGKRIYVAGAGYVGLVTAALFSQRGNFVSVYEKDERRRKIIESGKAPFFEPSLDHMIAQAKEARRMEVVTDPVPVVAASDFSFVAVGTPSRKDGSVDHSAVVAACCDIAEGLKRSSGYHVLAIRSTVFPGTTSGVVRETVEKVSGKRAPQEFGLIAYPEFLREGSAIQDMLHPDRVVLGALDDRSANAIDALVREFYGTDQPPVLRVSLATAEMIKYASNAFLATKIAFIDEIANLCEQFEDVDVQRVADGMGFDHRIGRAFLNAGIGFGGSCLPKDLRALVKGAKGKGVRLRIAEATLASNQLQPRRAIHLARELIGDLNGKRAAVLGLAFKPETSDMRDSPSEKLVNALLNAGMHVSVYDPAAMESARSVFGRKVRYSESIRDCLKEANCCFIVTEWDDFRTIPTDLFLEMADPIVIDGRRVFDPSKIDRRITYRSIGLGGTGTQD